MGKLIEQWKKRIKEIKGEVVALYFAYRDPRAKWYAKLLIIIVVGYAFSPIDLIPDFVPVLGYFDDFILIPLGVGLAIRLISPDVMAEARDKSRAMSHKPKNWLAAIIILAIWLAILGWIISVFF